MASGRRTLFAFLGGIACGYALGVLFAPDSGKNTRDKLAFQLDKYLESLSRLITEAKEKKEGEKGSSELNPNDQRRAEDLLREVETFMSQIKHTDANNSF